MISEGGQQKRQRCRIDQHREHHRVAHLARQRRADEDAVEDPACHPEQRRKAEPGQIEPRRRAHLGCGGHRVDDDGAGEKEDCAQKQRAARGPFAAEQGRPTQPQGRPRADRLPDEAFGGEGKAVERVGGDLEELHQNLVCGERHFALPGAKEQEGGEARLQQHRADHDVGIDPRHPLQRRRGQHPRPGQARTEGAAREPERQRQPRRFGD
ncbi:hypothetical protein SDC9_59530 [bioreactor metagenome]|uniref:Uncharacterized protein n=1 Tax=bioreactor metagenome TaxID=1076179 RepID=A0A644XAC8_9ZZZZ